MIQVKYLDKKKNLIKGSAGTGAFYAEVTHLDDKTGKVVKIDYYHIVGKNNGVLSV